jgi:hypothetical protein
VKRAKLTLENGPILIGLELYLSNINKLYLNYPFPTYLWLVEKRFEHNRTD